ncbi:general transcription factor II-I repeat domain-containing protein 2B [Trichonephila inaurata madagascariensis]|uniref:General transcription factor II-I repeat domain-containing protein 2B n=1 Tax=Trichonephila inaurata madagascariensis TaxID=2747483 RepID=A0A8X6JLA5_9ARAC|nr:general transcription factor II-I repeat domain-containing protein 2B [Trichonephila inaurata madagascariensis]
MYESTDATDATQVAIFVHVVDRDFTIIEELASVVALKGTARVTDLYSSLTQTLDINMSDFSNISAITTNGAKSMVEEKTGVTTLLKSDVKFLGDLEKLNMVILKIPQRLSSLKSEIHQLTDSKGKSILEFNEYG